MRPHILVHFVALFSLARAGATDTVEQKEHRYHSSNLVTTMALFNKVKSGIIASTVEEAAAAGASSFIGTHHGTFHCDEALATALLKLLPAFADHAVVRTRDPAQLAKCDIVVDVGGEYDDAAKRYDHHQKTFDTVLEGYKT